MGLSKGSDGGAAKSDTFVDSPEPVEVEEVLPHRDGLLHGHDELRLVPVVPAERRRMEEEWKKNGERVSVSMCM